LSEYGVPDDDMSDSLPPHGGPDPYDGWDLEGMLSGTSVWLPDGMRPVARTLSALRAAPTRAELSGEASARAAFRQVMQANGTGSRWPGRGAGDGHTLILPAQGAGGGPHAVTRPRHSHRRPPRHGRWQPKALAGAVVGAAVVAVVGGVALAGGFSATGGHPGQPRSSSSAVGATTASGHSGSNGLDGNANKAPTAHPTPSHSHAQSAGGTGSAAQAAELCRQYLAFFTHHESDWAKENDIARQLNKQAGGSRHIFSYCVRLPQPWAMTPKGPGSDLDGPGLSPPGDSQGGPGSGGPQDSQGDDQSKQGHSGNGPGLGGSVGNGRIGNDSGLGTQGQQ
jgi:hypothetical protein